MVNKIIVAGVEHLPTIEGLIDLSEYAFQYSEATNCNKFDNCLPWIIGRGGFVKPVLLVRPIAKASPTVLAKADPLVVIRHPSLKSFVEQFYACAISNYAAGVASHGMSFNVLFAICAKPHRIYRVAKFAASRNTAAGRRFALCGAVVYTTFEMLRTFMTVPRVADCAIEGCFVTIDGIWSDKPVVPADLLQKFAYLCGPTQHFYPI